MTLVFLDDIEYTWITDRPRITKKGVQKKVTSVKE